MTKTDRTNAFESGVREYDAWYDTPKGQALFETEARCLSLLLNTFARPYLEIGVGTGRFARDLAIEYGLDPSGASLELARTRSIAVAQGQGERLPFRRATFGAVLAAFTVCFVESVPQLLREVERVVVPGGGLVLGLLLRGEPWADAYATLGAEGHPIYRSAHFLTRDEVETMLSQAGFRVSAVRSALFQPPGLAEYRVEECRPGFHTGAGFTAIAATTATSSEQGTSVDDRASLVQPFGPPTFEADGIKTMLPQE